MGYILLLVSALVLASVDGKPSTLKDGRIVGGNAVAIEDYPYQLSLQYSGSHICGASIITNQLALTAAHCVDGVAATSLSIRAGSSIRGSGGVVVDISEIRKHLDYNSATIENDIALLKLSDPLEYGPTIQPIQLALTRPTASTSVTVSGWGATMSGGALASELQAVNLQIKNQNVCKFFYLAINPVTDKMICAGTSFLSAKGSCQGDSGGPLVTHDAMGATWQVGIVSWGLLCSAVPIWNGVYTDVSSYNEWIEENSI